MIRHRSFRNGLGLGQFNLSALQLRAQMLRAANDWSPLETTATLSSIPLVNRPDTAIAIPFSWSNGIMLSATELVSIGALPMDGSYLGVSLYLTDAANTLVVSYTSGPGFPPRPQLGLNRLKFPSRIIYSI